MLTYHGRPCLFLLSTALSLTIPFSMLADWIFKHDSPTVYLWLGSLCVIAGFVAVSLQPTAAAVKQTDAGGGNATDVTPILTQSSSVNLADEDVGALKSPVAASPSSPF
jgi:hypothetical protein